MNNLDNISDEELDKIFREASEGGFADNLQNEWPSMKARLERDSPEPGFWSKFRNVFFALLLLIPATLIYFGSKSNNSAIITNTELSKQKDKLTIATDDKKVNEEIPKTKVENPSKLIFLNSDTKVENIAGAKSEKFTKENVGFKKPIASFQQKLLETCSKTFKSKDSNTNGNFNKVGESNSIDSKKLAYFKNLKVKTFNTEPSKIQENAKFNSSNYAVNLSNKSLISGNSKVELTKPLDEQNIILQSQITENSTHFANKNELQQSITSPFDLNLIPSFLGPIVMSDNVKFDSTLQPTLALQKPAEKPAIEDYFKKGFYIQIGFSPELSIVSEFDKETPIGNNRALLLNYRFSKNWSMQSGAMQSLKYYSAYPADYKWIWKNVNTPLREINAVCRMIDIPVNVRYDFKASPRRKFFGSTGLTSYLMKKETYNYFYDNDADPSIKWRQWNGKTGFYKAGVLNFSAGMEYKLTKKLSLQIEPFAKIPIKQIGFGKVKLSSYGILLSANYPLNFN
jgi:hypothetical protein